MNTVKLSDTHISVIEVALETLLRLKLGQIKAALDTAYGFGLADWNKLNEIEKLVKQAYDKKAFCNVSDSDETANIAYEIRQVFRQYLAVKNNNGFFGSTVDFHDVLKSGKEPLPVIVDYKPYKDIYLTKKQSEKIQKLQVVDINEMWGFINIITKKHGINSEKIELVENPETKNLVIRYYKPQKIKQ